MNTIRSPLKYGLLLLTIALIGIVLAMTTTKQFWWAYLADYDGTPGSIRLDMAFHGKAPLAEYPHLIVTGTTYQSVGRHGLPEPADFQRLAALSQQVVAAVDAVTPSVYVGTFTYKHEQLNYVYVKSTANVPEALDAVYSTSCAGCKIYTNIKHDPAWSAYRDFLYPNQATRDFHREELNKIGLGAL